MELVQKKKPTLKSLEFSDIILGEEWAFLKGVPGGEPLEPLDETEIADLSRLREVLGEHKELEFSIEFDSVRYRVSRIEETVDGKCWYALRRAMQAVPSLEELGFAKTYRGFLCSEKLRKGLIVFCGSMGSGKTTSASALVKKRLELYGGHAITLEDPPEMPLHGIHAQGLCLQKEIKDFGQGIVQSLRYGAPEIIYLGELRAPNDVSQALRAAVNGHLLIATIHAGSVIEAAQRIRSLGSAVDGGEVTQDLMSSGIAAFIHQRLRVDPQSGNKRLQVEFLRVVGEGCQSVRSHLKSGKLNQLGSAIMEQRNKALLGRKK